MSIGIYRRRGARVGAGGNGKKPAEDFRR